MYARYHKRILVWFRYFMTCTKHEWKAFYAFREHLSLSQQIAIDAIMALSDD